MSSAPLVSAIIIFLNEECFLAQAIESVVGQSRSDWELLLVDDGSTDRSTAIARDFAARMPDRIRYLEHAGHANRGMSAARNLGLDNARGRYVGFLDGDDVWEPAKLAEQVKAFEANPRADMVYGRTLLWHSWRGDSPSTADEYCDLGVTPDSLVEPPRLLVNLIENRAQTPTTCNALMRRDAFERIGRFEETFRGMFEDQVFFMKLALVAPVYVSSKRWARYRQRTDSHSARMEASGEVRQAHMRLLAWLEAYLREQGTADAEVWRMLRRQQRRLRWASWRRYLPS
jgi:glycosyltransferase involved in cell wall biosynthesis